MTGLANGQRELSTLTSVTSPTPTPWLFSTRGIAVRLFITCWLVYALHFATNIVREIYPALSLGDHLSFRVDEYAHMHPDLFDKEGYGWHIGNNPGASMLAAIPYALSRPVIDPVVESVQRKRASDKQVEPPPYNSPWPMAREFYKEAWWRGLDIKFGLAAFVMQSMCMAPISALTAVVMFYLLRRLFGSDRTALLLSLLYAFGTPVFFRTGYLNQNLMLGNVAFMGLVAMWDPGLNGWWSTRQRFFLGGLAGGMALLMDYSGAVLLLGLFFYGLASRIRRATKEDAGRHAVWYVLGALGPVCLLWFYQWQSFGNPFLPGQSWMPPVEWIDRGYRGYGFPQAELLLSLAFDYRYGLFFSSPLMLLALLAPFFNRGGRRILSNLELVSLLAFFVAMWVFFSGSNYTRLQFNTGIRYMTAILPFLFVPASIALLRLPRFALLSIVILSITESWCLAMDRDVERGLGVLDPILRVFLGGFKLPVLTTLSSMGGQYGEFFSRGTSPLPFFILTAAILFAIWSKQSKAGFSLVSSGANHRNLERMSLDARTAPAIAHPQSPRPAIYDVDVVIPVLNEAHILEKSVHTVRQFLSQNLTHRWRIVVVDNGSTDGTDEVARGLKARFDDVDFIQLVQKGRGRALRYAWMQSNADIVSYMDVDLSTNLSHLPQLIRAIAEEGYDIATGSRLMRGAQTRRSLKREVVSRIYNLFLKAVLFTRFSDAQCGFKALSRRVVDHVVPQIEDQSWFFDTELLVLAEKQGYLTKDIPVVWVEDDDSRVQIIRTAWDDIKGVLRLRKQLSIAGLAHSHTTQVKREKT
jgi:hypothetical protein